MPSSLSDSQHYQQVVQEELSLPLSVEETHVFHQVDEQEVETDAETDAPVSPHNGPQEESRGSTHSHSEFDDDHDVAMLRSFSFDLDDEEEGLSRYPHFEPDRLEPGYLYSMSPVDAQQQQPKQDSSNDTSPVQWIAHLWKAYGEARWERRQLRTQQLLNLHTKRQRFTMWLSSWCDIFDRGWSVWLVVVLLWAGLCRLDSRHRRFIVGVGLPLLLIRFSISLCWCLKCRQQGLLNGRSRLTSASWDPMLPSIMIKSRRAEWQRPAYRDEQHLHDGVSDEPKVTIQIV